LGERNPALEAEIEPGPFGGAVEFAVLAVEFSLGQDSIQDGRVIGVGGCEDCESFDSQFVIAHCCCSLRVYSRREKSGSIAPTRINGIEDIEVLILPISAVGSSVVWVIFSNPSTNADEVEFIGNARSSMLPAHVEGCMSPARLMARSKDAAARLFFPFLSLASDAIGDKDSNSIAMLDGGEEFNDGYENFIAHTATSGSENPARRLEQPENLKD